MEYIVRMPVNAVINCLVEADSEEEAINKALEDCDMSINPESELGYELEEWEVFNEMIRGNVFYGIMHSAEAIEN